MHHGFQFDELKTEGKRRTNILSFLGTILEKKLDIILEKKLAILGFHVPNCSCPTENNNEEKATLCSQKFELKRKR